MLTKKQNYLEAVTYGKPEHVPFTLFDVNLVGMIANSVMECPVQDGFDAFGVQWFVTPDGPVPSNRTFLLEDITEWREIVKIPDVDAFPWEEWAKKENETRDENKVNYAVMNNGLFDRLVALMGYEEGLVSMAAEPEACYDFFCAIADYKVAYINKLHQYCHPDAIQYIDDLAHLNGLFMSPETYRKLIKPHHKRIIDAIHAQPNTIAIQHTCGKCQEIIPDYVEMGIQSWFPAQVVNDLEKIKKQYKGKLAFEFGMDSQGLLSQVDAPEEYIRNEVRSTIDHYGKEGGLTIFPVLLGGGTPLEPMQDRRYAIINDEIQKYGIY